MIRFQLKKVIQSLCREESKKRRRKMGEIWAKKGNRQKKGKKIRIAKMVLVVKCKNVKITVVL
jgi:hypothetical protein